MIHRLAIIVGSVAAAAILALGFLASGFGPRTAIVDAEQPSAVATTDTSAAAADASATPATASPVTRVETTTVYVRPAAKPKVIHVTRRASVPAKQQTHRVVKVRPVRHGGDDDHGGERGDD